MNNIKPQWVFTGFVVVGILWMTEASNRPDVILDNPFPSNDLVSFKHGETSASYKPVSLQPVDSLSVIDQQVTDKMKVDPLTAKMMVANRGEFFAIQNSALPAQEQVQLVDMGQQRPLSGNSQPCEFKSCMGQGASDY